jgi:hypothetical protein
MKFHNYYYFITKQIQTPIKIPQIYRSHAIGLKKQNQSSIKTKNHAFSASLTNTLLTKTRTNYHNRSLGNLKHA